MILLLFSRAKKGALEEFSSWVERLTVEGADWEVAAAKQELQNDIESHIERLIASKVNPPLLCCSTAVPL